MDIIILTDNDSNYNTYLIIEINGKLVCIALWFNFFLRVNLCFSCSDNVWNFNISKYTHVYIGYIHKAFGVFLIHRYVLFQRNAHNVEQSYWKSGVVAYTFDTSTSTPSIKQFGVYDLHGNYRDIITHIKSK